MPAILTHEVLLRCVGTVRVSVRVDDYKAWFTLLGTCQGTGDHFFALDKKEWEVLKRFINENLEYSNTIEITAKEPLQLQ